MQFTAEIMVKQSLHHYYQIQEIYMSDFRGFISDILFFFMYLHREKCSDKQNDMDTYICIDVIIYVITMIF